MSTYQQRTERRAELERKLATARSLAEWSAAWKEYEAIGTDQIVPGSECECGADDYPRPMGARAVHSEDCPEHPEYRDARGCQERVCWCHDATARQRDGVNFCSHCGCRW